MITFLAFYKKIRKNLSFILVALFAIISVAWALKVLELSLFPDFAVNYFSAQHVLLGETPYLIDTRYFTPQVYPPFVSLFFTPFALIPYNAAAKLWIVLSILAVIVVIYLLCRMHKIPFWSKTNALFIGLVFLSFPLKFTLGMGQINIVILLFVTCALYFLNKKYDYLSGFFLTLPLLLKFFPILLIPYLIYIKKWKVLFGFLITLFFLSFITVFILSLPVVTHYFQNILPDLLSSWKGDYYNQSLSGFLMRGVDDLSLRDILRSILSLSFLLPLGFVILKKKKKDMQQINLEISAIIILSLLINNFSWQHHFVLLIIPFFILYQYLNKNKFSIKYFFMLSLSYLLIATNSKTPQLLPILFQSHVFYGTLLLYSLNLFILFKKK